MSDEYGIVLSLTRDGLDAPAKNRARATEDHHRFRGRNQQNRHEFNHQWLLSDWFSEQAATLSELIGRVLHRFVDGPIPDYLIDYERLAEFDQLDRLTVAALLTDFYRNKYASYYDYDFSIISKHALSRIYESYVSILRLEESPQASLFPELPIEERDRAFGSVYSPQYIARFFARYIRRRTAPGAFKSFKVCDPACGSGIFLRTMLELQAEPLENAFDLDAIADAFRSLLGVDVDHNAAHATRLSLSLLHLVLTDRLPEHLNIYATEAIQFFRDNPDAQNTFDAVIANPPFVAVEGQTPEMRTLIGDYLGPYGQGRVDMSVPFLAIALRLLRPGGFGCFVLPHSFLLSKNASPIRRLLAENALIHCVADLSAVRVFGDVGSYVVLLIFQKHSEYADGSPAATVVKCQEFPGQALQDAVDDRLSQNQFYSVYKVDQSAFRANEWVLLPPAEAQLRRKLGALKTLQDFLVLKQGVVTGVDTVFIRPVGSIPANEREIFAPLLRDREMLPFVVPDDTDEVVFYPFVGNEKVDAEVLADRFPKTWAYLLAHRDRLSARGSLLRYRKEWWEPMWPRSPEQFFRSKLVSPHLILVPRFGWDVDGKYIVSRAPFFYPRTSGAEHDLLKYFLAVLNSSAAFWHLSTSSHRYRAGYLMLEQKTLASLPVPDPGAVEPSALRELLQLVDHRIIAGSGESLDLERQIDEIVASFYGLTAADRRRLGLD